MASTVTISSDFTDEERAFVDKVQEAAWKLILNQDVERCTLGRRQKWMYSGFVPQNYLGFQNDGSFFSRNLAALRLSSRQGNFPDMTIEAYYREDFSWGQANLDLVKTFEKGVEGAFSIALNRYQMGNRDVLAWASVVGHEMLHNLGHLHPKLQDDEHAYDNDWEINAYQSCIKAEGNRPQKHFATIYACGGRVH